MSDTPRTDAVVISPDRAVTSDYSILEVHARQLERELSEAKQWNQERAGRFACEENRMVRTIAKLSAALDECPWPVEVWPNTIEEVGTAMREAIGDLKTTAASGTIMRHAWTLARERLRDIAAN